MASRVLPDEDEYAELIPARGSITWQLAGDVRLFGASAYALILQTAHPTVGAGVAQYSGFAADPWGRLFRTLDYVSGSIYGGPQMAGEIGARVRHVHKSIKGVGNDGARYHALDPDAFAWVHATLAAAVVDGHHALGRRLTVAEREQFWREWRSLGRFIGVRGRDLPEDWDGFRVYFDRMCADVLVDHPTVHEVFDTLDKPKAPPVPAFPDWLWNRLRGPIGAPVKLVSIGLLPPLLRERFGLPWTQAHESAFNGLTRMARMTGPILLPQLKEFGPVYVKVRRKQLQRGDVAARTPPKREHALV